jgi:hypothetical protein
MSEEKAHHIDKRAGAIVENTKGNGDDLLSTRETAIWLGVSEPWLEIGRSRGWGPPFIRLSTRRIRYRRDSVLAWLAEREHARTSEYAA